MGDSEDEFRELRWRRQERRRRVQPAEPEKRHDGGSGSGGGGGGGGGGRWRPREAAVAGGVEGGSSGSAWREPPRELGGRLLAKGCKNDDDDHAARPPPAGRQVLELRPAEQPPDPAAEPGSPGAAGGLVFCQICQKDLSAMNAQRRQQHVNRCLDDLEKLQPPSSSIPECPICGKGFSTLKSRSRHLKRCAIRMEIPPPLLLQAVRQQQQQQQAMALGSSQPAALRGLKRKVSPSLEQTMEKHKMVKREGLAEDLLVAMAMSRTCLAGRETKAKLPTSRRQDGPSRMRKRLKAVREKPPQLPPPLLLQDPEKARQQTEERVALLLAEAEEFPGTPPLPASHLLEVEQSRQTHVASPAALRCSLWEFSSLAGPCAAPESFCAVGITLPVSPPPTDQRTGPGAAGLVVEQVPPGAGGLQGTVYGELAGSSTKPAGSQKDVSEALQDLVELAGEGLTLTQWELDVQQGAESGREREPGTVLQSCVVQPLEEELPTRRSCHPTFLLSSLAAAFRGMVNNPHLSDLQFQVDSGEVIYAHMFVLYARCPQLMEVVDHKGFVVAEGGDVRCRRVLLDNVSAEAVRVFLSHLYAGDHAIPLPVLSDVADLAVRFGVPDLAALCRGQAGSGSDGGEEEAGAERAEALEELLTSMWVGENQEAEAMLSWPRPEEAGGEAVGEQDLEEIYEFAATQRKAALSRAGEERGSNESQRQTASKGPWPRKGLEEPTATSGRKADPDPEPFRLQVQQSGREEGARGCPMEPLGDPKETTGPFGEPETDAVLGGVEDHRPELNESLESLFSRAPGESFELCQQSPDTRGGPSKDPTARRSLSVSPGGWELSSGLLSTLPLLVSPPIASLPGSSPQRRGAFSRDLSLTSAAPPLLPASQSSPCAKRNEATSLGQALGKGPHKMLRSLTLPTPPSHTNLEEDDDLILLSDSEEEVELGQEKEQVQAGASGKVPGAPAAISGCVSKEDSEAPLLGMLVRREAAQQPSSQGSGRVEDSWVEGSSWGQDDVVPDTPQLSRRGSGGTRGTKPSSESGPEQQWTQVTGGASPPPASWASVQSLKGALSPLAQPAAGKSAQGPAPPLLGLQRPAAEVVIVDDSEEELDPAPPSLSWDSCVLGKDPPFSEGGSSSYLLPSAGYSRLSPSPAKAVGKRGDSPLARTAALRFGEAEVSGSSYQGGAAWDGEDSGDDDSLPLGQQLPASLPLQKTPELACRTREVPCTTPLTPLPSYSIMETPELKKELSRFGVRALPKRQMVSKLKEIFQYTHQSRKADTQDRAAASQPASRCNQAKATQAVVACSTPRKQRSRLAEPLQGGQEGGSCQDPSRAGAGGGLGQRAELHCPQEGSGRPDVATFSPARLPAAGPVLPASQESVESSVSGSDASLVSQSSSLTEFEASMLAEEEEEEGIPASQAAAREADKLEALRRYIHSKPALSRQILLYQPFELAGLQAELKQNGIRIALGKLLDFLDAHCITFTTAEARREKNREKQQRPKRKGRRRRC